MFAVLQELFERINVIPGLARNPFTTKKPKDSGLRRNDTYEILRDYNKFIIC